MLEQETDRERQERIIAALLKVLGVAVAIGLVIGLGTWIVVKSLGLSSTEVVSLGPGPVQAPNVLPTTALPEPVQSFTPEPEPTGVYTAPTLKPGDDGLLLSASPVFVKQMERINLTGQWPGKDAMSLRVQRFEDGEWADFGVHAQVEVGTFATYVTTSREGDNIFRVYDPESGSASNQVTVTVG